MFIKHTRIIAFEIDIRIYPLTYIHKYARVIRAYTIHKHNHKHMYKHTHTHTHTHVYVCIGMLKLCIS